MSKSMTEGQRLFWKGILAFARTTRRAKDADLEAAADALALEQEIQVRFEMEEKLLAVAETATLELAPAEFQGWQDGFEDLAAFPLFRLTKDIAGHPAGSSVSAETLTKAGYAIPAHPAKPTTARERAL